MPPNLTALAPVRLVPVMVTEVPPAVGPEEGETAVTVGVETAPTVELLVTGKLVKLAAWLKESSTMSQLSSPE